MAEVFETLITDTADTVISIVGAGGKTSLMFLLAQAFQKQKLHVISTTTTRILKPTNQQTHGVFLFEDDDFYNRLNACLHLHHHATVAQSIVSEGDKLRGMRCADVDQLLQHSFAKRIIIEADGARQLAFKAPGENEPVVPETTDVYVSVFGLDSIGKPLDDTNVFRAELVSSRTGLQMGKRITPLAVAKLAIHPKGFLKYCPDKARSYIFFNKMDIPDGRKKAIEVMKTAQDIAGKQPDFWICGSIRDNTCAIINDL